MKNFYFIIVLGLLFVGCSIDNDEVYENTELNVADVTTCDISAGADKSATLTNSYVRSKLYGYSLLRNYYLRLLDEGVAKDGTFSPSINDLIKSYKTNNFQTFTTVYTVDNGECSDSVELSLTVVETLDVPTCSAGDDVYKTVTNDYVKENLYGYDLLKNYYLSLLDESIPTNGTFEPTIYSIVNSYKEDNLQEFTTTYTVVNGTCTDSAELTLNIIDPPVEEPTCSAGEDKSASVTNSYVRSKLYGYTLLKNYYLNLLDEGVAKDGNFSPSIYELVKSYKSDNYQTFSTTYTVTDEDCTDSTVLSLTVTP